MSTSLNFSQNYTYFRGGKPPKSKTENSKENKRKAVKSVISLEGGNRGIRRGEKKKGNKRKDSVYFPPAKFKMRQKKDRVKKEHEFF